MRYVLIAALLLATPAFAQTATTDTDQTGQTGLNRTADAPAAGARKDVPQQADPSLMNKAGLKKRVVTPLLKSALDAPYTTRGAATCPRIAASIAALTGELGSDVNERKPGGGSQAGYYAKRTSEFLLSPVYLARDIFREAGGERRAQDRTETEGAVATRGNAVREADQRMALQMLRAPVPGTVQELTVTNIGEVPEVGKPLVTIVPDGEPLVVEALLLNRDAGFVRAGMKAVVKLKAYPFTRYGTLEARVERVSPDATVDQRRGLVFPVRLKVARNGIAIEGQRVGLSPGMQASAEIVTGTRRVIGFLLSPIARAVNEAGRER